MNAILSFNIKFMFYTRSNICPTAFIVYHKPLQSFYCIYTLRIQHIAHKTDSESIKIEFLQPNTHTLYLRGLYKESRDSPTTRARSIRKLLLHTLYTLNLALFSRCLWASAKQLKQQHYPAYAHQLPFIYHQVTFQSIYITLKPIMFTIKLHKSIVRV